MRRQIASRAIVLGFLLLATLFSSGQTNRKTNAKWTNGPSFIRISESVADKLLIKRVEPVIPPEAVRRHVGGRVQLAIRIDSKGRVSEIAPISGPKELREAAMAAVLRWRYKPYRINGDPELVESKVTIDFLAR